MTSSGITSNASIGSSKRLSDARAAFVHPRSIRRPRGRASAVSHQAAAAALPPPSATLDDHG
jgi:hypothetical protein